MFGNDKKITMKKLLKNHPVKKHVEVAKNFVAGAIAPVKEIYNNYKDGQEKNLNEKIKQAVTKSAEMQAKEMHKASGDLKVKIMANFNIISVSFLKNWIILIDSK